MSIWVPIVTFALLVGALILGLYLGDRLGARWKR